MLCAVGIAAGVADLLWFSLVNLYVVSRTLSWQRMTIPEDYHLFSCLLSNLWFSGVLLHAWNRRCAETKHLVLTERSADTVGAWGF